MAKLQGVKVIEATGGEITKVAYDGAEYKLDANADYKANKGDLVRINEDYDRQIINGEFYEVVGIGYVGDALYRDEEGDERCAYVFDVYRKIEEASELTTKFNVGDVVVTLEKCGWAKGGQGLMLAGAIGKVKAVGGDLLTVKFNKKQPLDSPNTNNYRKNFVVRTSEVRLAAAEEAATIAKKKKRLTVGDYAEVVARETMHRAELGDIVRIVTDELDQQPYKCERVSDGNDVGWFRESELKRADKPSQSDDTITFEGEQYRKVDRKAQAGDVVVFRENTSCCVKNDTPYLVEISRDAIVVDDGGRDFYSVYFGHYGRTPETVDVYEKVEAKYVPQEGDIVVITANTNASANKVGEIGKITKLGDFGWGERAKVEVIGRKYNDDNNTKLNEFRKATPAEVEAYEKAVAEASKPKLKAGDFVKFEEPDLYDITVGKIYEVKADDNGNLCIIDDAGYEDYSYLAEFAIKVDAEEVAKHADEAKWAKIGRKVGEINVGDIVEITEDCSGAKVGEIVKVSRVCEDGDGSTRIYYDHHEAFKEYTAHYGSYMLVAPVESTLN